MTIHLFQFPGLYLPEGSKLKALLTRLQTSIPIRTISGTTGALTSADWNGHIRTTSGSATALTVPLNATVAFPIGTVVTHSAYGAGAVTLTPADGVTLNKMASKTLVVSRYGEVKLRKVGTNEWDVTGDLVAA